MFERLIRFVDKEGRTHYGDVPASENINEIIGKSVKILNGGPFIGLSSTGDKAVVEKVHLQYSWSYLTASLGEC